MELVFEGINGSGKSTLIHQLRDALSERGLDVLRLSEVKSKTAREIRKVNIDRAEWLWDHRLESGLVGCERRCDLNVLQTMTYDVALIERGIASFHAYASVRGLEKSFIENMILNLIPDFPTANWILVDTPADVALKRLQTQSRHRYEEYSRKWYHQLRTAFLERAASSGDNVIILDGQASISTNVCKIIDEFF